MGFVGLVLLLDAAGAALGSGPARGWYLSLVPPPGSLRPATLSILATAIYVCSGTAGWLVWRAGPAPSPPALRLWGWCLAAHALRVAAFFGLRSPRAALALCFVSLVLLLLTIRSFAQIRRAGACLMVPSTLWTGYVAYLVAGFALLNPV